MSHQSKQSSTSTGVIEAPRTTSKQPTPVCELTIKPGDQSITLLGEFDQATHVKGYSIELSPEPQPEDSVVSEVTRIDTANTFKLYLNIANYGSGAINATVCRL